MTKAALTRRICLPSLLKFNKDSQEMQFMDTKMYSKQVRVKMRISINWSLRKHAKRQNRLNRVLSIRKKILRFWTKKVWIFCRKWLKLQPLLAEITKAEISLWLYSQIGEMLPQVLKFVEANNRHYSWRGGQIRQMMSSLTRRIVELRIHLKCEWPHQNTPNLKAMCKFLEIVDLAIKFCNKIQSKTGKKMVWKMLKG